jgi:hypothetical protein
MQRVKCERGKVLVKGKGYLWTKRTYDHFELSFSCKFSEGDNSGVFHRCDKSNPIRGGFQVELMDNEGFQKTYGKKDAMKLTGSLWNGQTPSWDTSKRIGIWVSPVTLSHSQTP